VNGLEQCPVGRPVKSGEDVKQALCPIERNFIKKIDRTLVDTFVANLDARHLLHLDSRA